MAARLVRGPHGEQAVRHVREHPIHTDVRETLHLRRIIHRVGMHGEAAGMRGFDEAGIHVARLGPDTDRIGGDLAQTGQQPTLGGPAPLEQLDQREIGI